jgi:hypothetical protein
LTTARQAYDLIAQGLGVGANGPLLVGVKLATKAAPHQKNLDALSKQEKDLQRKQQQIVQQGLARGLSAQQAQQQAERQTSLQSAELAEQKQRAESPATDPRLTTLQKDIAKADDVKWVSPPTLDKSGAAAVYTVVAKTAPSSRLTEDLVQGPAGHSFPRR